MMGTDHMGKVSTIFIIISTTFRVKPEIQCWVREREKSWIVGQGE